MEVHFDDFKFQVFRPIITIGTFDGVHLGHRSVIEELKKRAFAVKGESVVVTFDPHPRYVVSKDAVKPMLLNTLSEKIYRFSKLGIDHLLVISFTEDFANLSYAEFFEQILVAKLNIHTLLVGYDHKFGKNRQGNFAMLKELGQKHDVCIAQTPELQVAEQNVSSTTIRNLLQNGEVERVAEMLDYNYSIKGKVVDGDKIGRTLGFPTANIALPNPHKLTPQTGVYAVRVYHKGRQFYGMMNIGFRPSVSLHNECKIEVHIFYFNEEIYGDELRVSLIKRIRDEVKFNGLEALTQQLEKDCKAIKNFFGI